MNSISTELFFNEAEFSILIPNYERQTLEPLGILQADRRDFAFYDEHLHVYLLARIPSKKSGTGEEVKEAISAFYNQLEISLDAAFTELAQTQRTSTPGSPKFSPSRRPDTPFFTHTFNTNSTKQGDLPVFEHDNATCCLYSMMIPIVYVKTKATNPVLSILCNVQYKKATLKRAPMQEIMEDEYDTDSFETVNLLGGLSEDPTFSRQDPVQRFIIGNPRQLGSSTPQVISPSIALKRIVKESLPMRSGLMVKMRTTNASVVEKMVMMSIELENPPETDCEFIVETVEVVVSNAVVSNAFHTSNPIEFPLSLGKSDLTVFVYDVSLLDDVKPPVQPQLQFASRRPMPQQPVYEDKIQPQRVSIQICCVPVICGVKAAPVRSKWNTMLDVRQKREDAPVLTEKLNHPLARSHSVAHSPGTRSVAGSPHDIPTQTMLEGVFGMKKGYSTSKDLAARRAPEKEIADGIIVSFTVPDKIYVGKKFLLHVFIVNRSKHTRRFQVMIPNRKRFPTDYGNQTKSSLPPLPMEPLPVDPYMSESEFLKQYFENETHEADVICLESNIKLSPLGPSTSQSVDIEFIAVKEKLHTIDLVQLVDQDTGFVTNLRHVLEIYVESQ
ncbi:TRAPP trafficking subunit Trs65-domain-containing protein [Sporodiniella umbellata]|nr:TRAPP trafficking subunit Trs65-domain-containing protein [Sporodiniella umbellata]